MGGFALPSMKHFLPQERIAKECSCLLWHSRLNFLDPLQSECKIFFHRKLSPHSQIHHNGYAWYEWVYNSIQQELTIWCYDFRICKWKRVIPPLPKICDPISCLGRHTTFRRQTLQRSNNNSCGVGAGAANTAKKKTDTRISWHWFCVCVRALSWRIFLHRHLSGHTFWHLPNITQHILNAMEFIWAFALVCSRKFSLT